MNLKGEKHDASHAPDRCWDGDGSYRPKAEVAPPLLPPINAKLAAIRAEAHRLYDLAETGEDVTFLRFLIETCDGTPMPPEAPESGSGAVGAELVDDQDHRSVNEHAGVGSVGGEAYEHVEDGSQAAVAAPVEPSVEDGDERSVVGAHAGSIATTTPTRKHDPAEVAPAEPLTEHRYCSAKACRVAPLFATDAREQTVVAECRASRSQRAHHEGEAMISEKDPAFVGPPGYYNPDPEIDAGVRADAAIGALANLVAGLTRWFTCPTPGCYAQHDRGPVNGGESYRCLRCGETTDARLVVSDAQIAAARGSQERTAPATPGKRTPCAFGCDTSLDCFPGCPCTCHKQERTAPASAPRDACHSCGRTEAQGASLLRGEDANGPTPIVCERCDEMLTDLEWAKPCAVCGHNLHFHHGGPCEWAWKGSPSARPGVDGCDCRRFAPTPVSQAPASLREDEHVADIAKQADEEAREAGVSLIALSCEADVAGKGIRITRSPRGSWVIFMGEGDAGFLAEHEDLHVAVELAFTAADRAAAPASPTTPLRDKEPK